MYRFIQTHSDNKLPDNYYDYMDYPLFPLMTALEPLLLEIDQLHTRIKLAEHLCCYPSDYKLTKDESATIYLYTDNCDEQSVYYQLNRALRSENPSMLKPWLGFLKLFHAALEKLPTVKSTIWRGIHIDIAKNFRENQDIIWCCVSSCSLSIDRVKIYLDKSSILCSIEAINGKSIRGYTRYIKEDEVLLLPGTRLRVKKNAYDSSIGQHVIRLVEMTNDNHSKSASIPCSISSTNKLPENTSGMANSMETGVSKANITLNNHLPNADELTWNIDSSITRFSNGDRYEVTYKKGEKKGYSKFYAVTGEICEGCFADIRANGDGVRICSSGDRYEGTFRHGEMYGYGTHFRADGYTYVGKWIADEAYGEGTSTWQNGNHYEGYHEKGKIKGYGTFYSDNGDKYQGYLDDGKAHGQGVRIWANGDRYEGNFENDQKHGYGTYSYSDGAKYGGRWAYDEMNGQGRFTWSSGTQYEGEFKNGKRHGWGKLTFGNGQVQRGHWKNDRYIG